MEHMDRFVTMVVQYARAKGAVSMGMLRTQLLRAGMGEEELSLLLDIVALEVRLNPSRVSISRRSMSCRGRKPTSALMVR